MNAQKAVCPICPHACSLAEGEIGLCKARAGGKGCVISLNYGKATSIALDPIEKKPLIGFYPGSKILSVGSFGCNLRCPFCQNHEISMHGEADSSWLEITPEEICAKAAELQADGNIGLAFTYNEPFIGYEFLKDAGVITHQMGMKNVVVTNGYVNEEPLKAVMPLIDAMNIDLKAYSQSFYKMIGGDLGTVKRTIEVASNYCHVEIACLIIDGENDSPDEMDQMAAFLSSVSSEIILHINRFFPRYKYSIGHSPSNIEGMLKLAEIAKNHLKNVTVGNIG